MMKKLIPALYFILLLSQALFSQQKAPEMVHMRLSGVLADKTELIIHLSLAGDSLFGNLIIHRSSTALSGLSESDPPLLVYGRIEKNGTFWMRSAPSRDKAIFKGRRGEKNRFTGIWEPDIKSGKQISVVLTENYPAGSIPLVLTRKSGMKKLVEGNSSPVATSDLAILSPDRKSNLRDLQIIRQIIVERFSEKQASPPSDRQLLEGMEAAWFENYISDNQSLIGEIPSGSMSWELMKFMHIVHNEGGLLSFYIHSYTFTGGAHGLETRIFSNIDLRSGKLMTTAELFKPGSEAAIGALLTKKLLKMNNLPPTEKLQEAGYFVSSLEPSGNFYISENGIGFVYNAYDIAPYSYGETEIFLTNEEIRPFLKQP